MTRNPQTTLPFFATLMLLAVLGCKEKTESTSRTVTTAAAAKPKPLVGVSLLTLTNPFFKQMGDAMVAEGTRQGYEVLVESGENDPARQKDQVKDFLTRKASAIVLTPCDSKSIGVSIVGANQTGVPVFTADVASVASEGKVVCHVATDNLEGGRVAGRAMVQLLRGHGKVAVIGHPKVESGMARERGFNEEIAKSPEITIVASLPGNGARDKAFAAAQDILQAHPNLDAIFGINDPMALGAIAAIEKSGLSGKVKVIGFDGQLEARQAIKDGKMEATVMQYPTQIGATSIDMIARYMAGNEVEKQILIPPTLYRQADTRTDAQLR